VQQRTLQVQRLVGQYQVSCTEQDGASCRALADTATIQETPLCPHHHCYFLCFVHLLAKVTKPLAAGTLEVLVAAIIAASLSSQEEVQAAAQKVRRQTPLFETE
jgi:hypothetical protein